MTLGVALLVMMLFLYVSSDWIYGVYSELVKNVLVVYFFLFVMIHASLGTPISLLNADILSVSYFSVGFILTVIFMYPLAMVLPAGVLASVETVKLSLGFGLLHGFVKAFIEEDVFRGVLLSRIGLYPSNILFGLFHVGIIIMTKSSMGQAITLTSVAAPVVVLVLMGFIWSYLAKRFNLMAAVGSHFGYNLGVLGLLPKVVGVG